MRSDGGERCLVIAEYVLRTGATVREAARAFALSKSSVHKDLTGRLRAANPETYALVRELMDYHLSQRHLRGGEATRRKYLSKA